MARIMIVEDEPLIALLLEGWVSDMGHEAVGPARTLAEARNLGSQPLDAAVIDVRLGDQSGFCLLEILKVNGVPCILATGEGDIPIDYLNASAGILVKPYSFDSFELAINQMLSN